MKRKEKRWPSKMLVACFLVGIVLGAMAIGPVVAQERVEVPVPPEQTVEQEAVEITYWGAHGSRTFRYMDELFRRFMNKNPQIKVNSVPIPFEAHKTKFISAMQTGTGADVSEMWGWMVAPYEAVGGLENLEPYLRDWPRRDEIVPAAFGASGARIVDDRPYYFPLLATTWTMFYRRDWFKEAGIAEPTFGWTWEDLRDIAEKLTRPEQNRWGIQLRGGAYGNEWYWTLMFNFAGEKEFFDKDGKSNLDAPGAAEGLRFWADLYRKGLATPSSPTDGFKEMIANFGGGSAGIFASHVQHLGPILDVLGTDKIGMAPFPMTSDGNFFMPWFWDGYAMWSGSKHKDTAWELMDYLLSQEGQSYRARAEGMIVTNKRVWEEGWFKYNRYYPAVLDVAEEKYTMAYPIWLPGYDEFGAGLGPKLFQQVCFDQITAEEAAKQMADYFTKAYKEYRERKGQ